MASAVRPGAEPTGAARDRARHRSCRPAALALALFAAFAPVPPAAAKETEFGPFRRLLDLPGSLFLSGEIRAGDHANLLRALAVYPETRNLILESEGGLISEALLIAGTVHDRRIATYVPPSDVCASACALVWFAGPRRQADGRLGVHRFASPGGFLFSDEGETQDTVGRIVELLDRFGTPRFVLVPMLRTPHDSIHWFEPPELGRLQAGRRFDPDIASILRAQLPPEPPLPLADAPGADCAAETDRTLRALCRDPRLAGLDRALAERIAALTGALPPDDAAALAAEQAKWEAKRSDCAGNLACLERAYAERLAALRDGPG
ncbi:MAG: hypothetical protein ACKVPY_11160 [Paracoccaceae bacterium]